MHQDEIPPGTLYLLILRTLARGGEMHGYEIANSIQQISEDVARLIHFLLSDDSRAVRSAVLPVLG